VFFVPLLILTSVTVPGTDLAVKLQSQVGQPYDEQKVTADVRYLWNLGRFDDVSVEEPEPGSLVFRVHSKSNLMLHEIWLEPNTFGIDLKVEEDTFLDEERAHQIAREAARQLEHHGYTNPKIREEIVPKGNGWADLHLHVTPGEDLKVKGVDFQGDDRFRDQLQALKPTTILPHFLFLPGWRLLPGYNESGADSDIARIQSAYLRQGYLDAVVRPGDLKIRGTDVRVGINADPGPKSTLSPDLCSALLVERRDAQKQGILEFTARYDTEHGLSVERGPVYHVGRIEFSGNHHFSDSTIRKNFVLDEGDLFDELQLRRSIARLNRTNFFESVDEKHVVVHPNPETGYADITVRLTERKRGRWGITGPAGPTSVFGQIQGSVSSRLPGFPTYALSLSLFIGKTLLPVTTPVPMFMPIFAVQRAFTPGEGWLSGFLIAPQLGWQSNLLSYGIAQIQGRLMPRISGERDAQPVLPVYVTRPEGEATMFCEAPKPHLMPLRSAAGVALHFLGALPVM
jgi:outer membrane protein insertion porin family